MRLATLLIAAMLAGCASTPTEEPKEDTTEEPRSEDPVVLINGSTPWPMMPGSTASIPFDVPNGTESLEVRFNWQGQKPGGISSDRDGVVISPDGDERSFMGPDLPANPYLCASPTCGPADDRVERFDDPAVGTWRIELRGVYTATAFYFATASVPAGNATAGS